MQNIDLCSKCCIKEICTVFQLKREKMHDIEMVISKCKYASSIQAEDTPIVDFSNGFKSIENDSANTFAESFDEKEYKKFLERQNDTSVKDKDILATCETCGGTCYQSDITICSKCGKVVCANCGTGFEGHAYCEKCWEDV